MLNLIIVEDNTDDLLLFERRLQKLTHPYAIHAFQNVPSTIEYLEILGKEHADRKEDLAGYLMLLDLNLGAGHGFEILRYLKSHAGLKSIPVFILTASKDKDDVSAAYRFGGTLFLKKPFELESFQEALNQLIMTSRLKCA